MKNLLLFLLCLFAPLFARADFSIPSIIFMGYNIFLSSTFFGCGLGIILFFLVCYIEYIYFKCEVPNPPQKLGLWIFVANLVSTILGGILVPFLGFFVPTGPGFWLFFIFYQFICLILSWLLEYLCLKGKFENKILQITFMANVLSYILLTIVSVIFIWIVIGI